MNPSATATESPHRQGILGRSGFKRRDPDMATSSRRHCRNQERFNLPLTVYSGESFVTTAQNFSIWRAIRELSNDPTLGWKFMSQVETDQFHPTLLAALHARTYSESIERLARYKQLCSAEEFRFTPKGDAILVEVFNAGLASKVFLERDGRTRQVPSRQYGTGGKMH
jgi:hypothetical protein